MTDTIDPILKEFLESEGYKDIRMIPGRGVCALFPYMFTVGIVYGIDKHGYEGRYCYTRDQAILAAVVLSTWDGKEDPIGPWIKHKSVKKGEYSNPNLNE